MRRRYLSSDVLKKFADAGPINRDRVDMGFNAMKMLRRTTFGFWVPLSASGSTTYLSAAAPFFSAIARRGYRVRHAVGMP